MDKAYICVNLSLLHCDELVICPGCVTSPRGTLTLINMKTCREFSGQRPALFTGRLSRSFCTRDQSGQKSMFNWFMSSHIQKLWVAEHVWIRFTCISLEPFHFCFASAVSVSGLNWIEIEPVRATNRGTHASSGAAWSGFKLKKVASSNYSWHIW